MNAILLEARGLVKNFGGVTALKDLDVMQHEGETLGMIGPNGSGKTTFVNAVTGHLALDAGALEFCGRNIRGLRPHRMAHIGLMRTYQAVRVLTKLTVAQNLDTALVVAGSGLDSHPDHLRQTVEWLELDTKLSLDAGNLTLFEQRKLELAMRMMLRPKLIMFDEPVGGLSAMEIRAMMKVLNELKARCAIFVIEHTMRVIRELADRVVVLVSGEKIADGPPADVLADAQVVENYLGTRHA